MTSILTKKYTCDDQGNWIEVPIVLTRVGQGWVESSPSPSDRAVERKAA
jgi:hypothetical protein